MKKIKILKVLLAMSTASLVGIGCYHNLEVFNNSKIIDVSKVKEDENRFFYRSIDITNKTEIKKFNILEISSFDGVFDEESSSYKISMILKNLKKEDIKNLNLRFTAIGLDSTIDIKDISKDLLKSEDELKVDFILSKENLLTMFSSKFEDKENSSIKKELILELLENEMSNIKLEYTYENDLDSNLCITQFFNFKGESIATNMNLYKNIDNINDLKINHNKSKAYLNLIKPEDTTILNDIVIDKVTVNIDKEFNFDITVNITNNSDNKLTNFIFSPNLNFNGNTVGEITSNVLPFTKNILEPNETIDFTVKIRKNYFMDALSKLDSDTLSVDFKGSSEELIDYLIKNRLVSLYYSYSYENDVLKYFSNVSYSNSSRLQSVYTTITDVQ